MEYQKQFEDCWIETQEKITKIKQEKGFIQTMPKEVPQLQSLVADKRRTITELEDLLEDFGKFTRGLIEMIIEDLKNSESKVKILFEQTNELGENTREKGENKIFVKKKQKKKRKVKRTLASKWNTSVNALQKREKEKVAKIKKEHGLEKVDGKIDEKLENLGYVFEEIQEEILTPLNLPVSTELGAINFSIESPPSMGLESRMQSLHLEEQLALIQSLRAEMEMAEEMGEEFRDNTFIHGHKQRDFNALQEHVPRLKSNSEKFLEIHEVLEIKDVNVEEDIVMDIVKKVNEAASESNIIDLSTAVVHPEILVATPTEAKMKEDNESYTTSSSHDNSLSNHSPMINNNMTTENKTFSMMKEEKKEEGETFSAEEDVVNFKISDYGISSGHQVLKSPIINGKKNSTEFEISFASSSQKNVLQTISEETPSDFVVKKKKYKVKRIVKKEENETCSETAIENWI